MGLEQEFNALLAELSRLQGTEAAKSLFNRAVSLHRAVVHMSDNGGHVLLDSAFFRAAGEQLAALAGTLQAACSSGRSSSAGLKDHLTAASILADSCVVLIRLASPAPADVLAVSRCAALLLGPGAAVLAECAASSPSPRDRPSAAVLVQQQAALMYDIVYAVKAADVEEEFDSQVAAPADVARWLGAAAAAAHATLAPAQQGGAVIPMAQFASVLFATVALLLGGGPDRYQRHAAALAQLVRQQRAGGSLLGIAAFAVQQAARALAQPPEQRQQAELRLYDWQLVGALAAILQDPLFKDALCAHLQPAAGTKGSVSSAALQFVQAVSQLLADAPLQQGPFSSERAHSALLCDLVSLLGLAADTLAVSMQQQQQQQQQQPGRWGMRQRQLVQHLLKPLPRLPRLLQPAAERRLPLWEGLVSLSFLLQRLLEAEREAGEQAGEQLRTLPEVQSWCAAGAAALRALPQASAVMEHFGTLATLLPISLIAVPTFSFGRPAAWGRLVGLGPGTAASPGEVQQAASSLWELHTAACRALNWLSAGGVESIPPVGELQVAGVVAGSYLAASMMGPADRTCLEAMAVATCQALQSWACDLGRQTVLLQDWRQAALVAMALAHAAAECPAVLWRHPALLELLQRAQQSVPEDRQSTVAADLLQVASHSPRLVAHLLDAGWVASAAEKIRSDAVTYPDAVQAGCAIAAYLHAALAALVPAGGPAVAGWRPEDARMLLRKLQPLQAIIDTAQQAEAAAHGQLPGELKRLQREALPPARRLAAALLEHWPRPEQQQEDALALAQAAAARSCAYLRCANLAGEGGPAAGQGAGSSKCSACRVAWYCSEACSHADWRGPGGHRRTCKALAAVRAQQRAAAAAVPEQQAGS